MQFLKKCTAAITVVSLVGIALVIVAPQPARGAGGPDVVVTNIPLPVSGNVNATVTGTVGITGVPTVTIGNPAGTPVLIRDVDGAREPFQVYSGLVLFDPIPNVHQANFGVVPAGKRLVIEHFSARIYNNAGGPPFYAKLIAGSGVDILVPNQIDPNEPYMVNTDTRMYANAGEGVLFETNINGQGYLEAFVSGYFVPVP